jgi:protein ImuB
MSRSIVVVFPQWLHQYGQLGAEHAFRQFEHVVRAITSVSPLVEVEEVGVMVMSARGPSRYFGGDIAVAEKLHQVCTQANVNTPWGVGIAHSRFAATVAAHLAVVRQRPCVIDIAISQQFLHAVPVASLTQVAHITPNTVDLLQRLGLRTCGAVSDIGEVALIDRFGIEGKHIFDLVSGSEVRHLAPGAPPSDFARTLEYETPLANAAHVVAYAQPHIEALVSAIASAGQQCTRVLISCETDHAEHNSRIWAEPRGFGAAAIAQRLLVQSEGWLEQADHSADPDAPSSGVVRVQFTPLECREVMVTQPLLWGGHQENTERVARAVSMTMASDPAIQISVPRWEGGRDVATVYSLMPVSLIDLTDAVAAQQRVSSGEGVARDWSGSVLRPSPASVPVRPPTIYVTDAQHNNIVVTGRHELSASPAVVHVGAQQYEVVQTAGPWPVEERWWDPLRRRRHVRMQLLVQHPRGGTTVFLVALENHAWSLVGRYD